MNYNIYFSPTGSTQKVTTHLAQEFGEYKDIDLSTETTSYHMTQKDFCIVGVPSFGGRVPHIAIERMKKILGTKTPVLLVVTYGNRDYDDTFIELSDTLKNQGFLVVGAIASVTEHSIVHKYGKGRPNENDLKELREFAQRVKKNLSKVHEIVVPGKRPYKVYNGVPLKPYASSKCIKCGMCARKCPVQAIPQHAPQETDHDICISCMRCIVNCPQHARQCDSALINATEIKLQKVCSTEKKNELFI